MSSTTRPVSTDWEHVLSLLRRDVNPGAYETWFRPTRLLDYDGHTMRISVPNEMSAEWLRSQYLPAIRATLHKAGLSATEIEFVPPRRIDNSVGPLPLARLNPRYTFDNFVVSSCNQFAHAAALAICDQPGRTYNPLFLYGGVGLGKTHLMQAIGNKMLAARPSVRLRYMTSEQFMNDLISAIRFEETPRFREKCRSLDVLLIDDVQFLAGKESTQEEFFHTFNSLYDAGKQIVLTSDKPPRGIPSVEERLRSRFEWGLIADIQPPDLETKVAILNKMAGSRGWSLPSDVCLFIAGHIRSNVRELEGCLTTLMAAASLRHAVPCLNLARDIVENLIPAEKEMVTLETVIRVVARHFELKVQDIKSRTNARRISYPRQIAMYLGKKLAKESFPSIGEAFGGMHHTTVMHAVKKITAMRDQGGSTAKVLSQIEQELA
ncbi:MAG: chromosomal replication initiator protein DnaA [Acidobacteria bacterium]|nr:chromosomal replication initiator protein DnaA [Acidobacteriota bacterium]